MTLQEYFTWSYYQDKDRPIIDYSVRVSVYEGKVTLYIHPTGRDGETTPTLEVQGNSVYWPAGSGVVSSNGSR